MLEKSTMKTTPCPNCGASIVPASLLAALSRGTKRNFTRAQRRAAAQRLAKAREKRWPEK